MNIEKFIEELSLEKESKICENFYKDERKKNNLRIYLEEMMKTDPKILFVGEAPGCDGCAITGIPFTDERIIREYNALPGQYSVCGYEKEKSAKAVWDVLKNVEKLPLLWNSFPLHPHKAGNRMTNRTPSVSEKQEIGEKYIRYIIELFNIEKIYAIGVQAFDMLKEMNIKEFDPLRETSYIRHPSHGGQKQCQEKIKEILKG